jgi:ABC-2 type transport system ATP-binding protein
MIQVDGLTARSKLTPKVDVGPVTFSLDRGGSYALVGAPHDGVDVLLAVLAGALAPRKGTATIAGNDPGPSRSVAYVPYTPDLPAVLRVDEYLRVASRVRGEAAASPEERLATLGVAPLARRRIADLSLEESRAVALAEALTSQAWLLLLSEPLVELDPRAVSRVPDALKARVEAGTTVVIATASRTDSRALAREQLVFSEGKLLRRVTEGDGWAPPMGPRGARLFIRSEGARFLLAELSPDPIFDEVHGEGAALVVTGKDPVAMAARVAAASRRANVEIDLLEFEDSSQARALGSGP